MHRPVFVGVIDNREGRLHPASWIGRHRKEERKQGQRELWSYKTALDINVLGGMSLISHDH